MPISDTIRFWGKTRWGGKLPSHFLTKIQSWIHDFSYAVRFISSYLYNTSSIDTQMELNNTIPANKLLTQN